MQDEDRQVGQQPAEKELGVLKNRRLRVSQHHSLVPMKAGNVVASVNRTIASWSRKVIFFLFN